MDDFRQVYEIGVIAGPPRRVAQIPVLHVHEIPGAEPPHRLEDVAANHEAGAGHSLDLKHARFRDIKSGVAPEPRFREHLPEVLGIEELVPDGGKGLETARLNGQIPIQEATAHNARIWVCPESGEHGRHGRADYRSI